MEMFLKSWWSQTYNRPLKDPILENYTIFELMYEYHDKKERELAADFLLEEEADKIEGEAEQETFDWIEEEERKEAEAEKARAEQAKLDEEVWMVEQLKKEHGDDFGEDIGVDFSE